MTAGTCQIGGSVIAFLKFRDVSGGEVVVFWESLSELRSALHEVIHKCEESERPGELDDALRHLGDTGVDDGA
jgi:hypothetical protein